MTDAEKQLLAAAFFKDRLAPAAQALRARNVSLFPVAPDPDADSYFQPCDPDKPLVSEIDLGHAAAMLQELWTSQELPELAEIAHDLMQLARALKQEQEDTGEISPFIYEMY